MNKKRIIILASGVMPIEEKYPVDAEGIRSFHFLRQLVQIKDLDLRVYYILNSKRDVGFENYFSNIKFKYFLKKDLVYRKIIKKNELRKFYAMISLNNSCSFIASKLHPKIPFWADLNGYLMAEAQSKSFIENDNKFIDILWRKEAKILQNADKISCPTDRQRYAIIGELTSLGRLNKFTENYDFVCSIPLSIDYFMKNETSARKIERKVKKDQFNILWAGGYNTWTDSVTMFKALQEVMDLDKNVIFYSTGGSIKGHNNKTFEEFKNLAKNSRFKDRFVFLGWVSNDELNHYYNNCDLALMCDRSNYETLIGARNRVLEMIANKIPILISLKSEISCILKDNKLAVTYKIEDYKDLAWKIIFIKKNYKKVSIMSNKAFVYFNKNYGSGMFIKPLLTWLNNPIKAEDFNKFKNPKKGAASLLLEFFVFFKKNGINKVLRYLFLKNK